MNGRKLFLKYDFIIKVLVKMSKYIPTPLFSSLYNVSSISEGKLPLLIRYLYLKKYCLSCGDNIFIGRNVVLKNLDKLSLGSNVSIHSFNYIDAAGSITIGNDVSIANMTSIISFNHTWENPSIPIKYNDVRLLPIIIDDDVWIGGNVKILGGVTVNKRTVLAAGAVVSKDVESMSIVGGVPAKTISVLE